jgi:hypothetical protein
MSESKTTACRPHHLISYTDLYYLQSILRNLDELSEISMKQVETGGYGLANDMLADNRDWLGCFIARFTGEHKATETT